MDNNCYYKLLLISLLLSCGGNEATFKSFKFDNCNLNQMQLAITNLKKQFPMYVDTFFSLDTPKYKYCTIQYKGNRYSFCYRLYDSLNCCGDNIVRGNCVKLSLKTANLCGNGLPLSKNISKEDKELYAIVFEDSFIKKLIVFTPKGTYYCSNDY